MLRLVPKMTRIVINYANEHKLLNGAHKCSLSETKSLKGFQIVCFMYSLNKTGCIDKQIKTSDDSQLAKHHLNDIFTRNMNDYAYDCGHRGFFFFTLITLDAQ